MKDKWYPVGTYPPETDDYSPPRYSKLFQNGNGVGGDDGHIPNAWARTKSNGNKIVVWDSLWEANVDDIGPSILSRGAGNNQQGWGLELSLAMIEAITEPSDEPEIEPGDHDPFVGE